MATAIFTLTYLMGAYTLINVAEPLVLTAVLGLANWQMARAAPESIWTPIFAFRLAVLVFIGVGAFLPLVLDDAIVDHMKTLYPYTEGEAAKVNLLGLVSTTIALAGAKAGSFMARPKTDIGPPPATSNISTLKLGVIFFAVGVGFLLLVEIPQMFDIYSFVLPNVIIRPFQAANAVGIFLLSLWCLERGGWALAVPLLLLAFNTLVGIVTMNKTMVLVPALLFGLAVLMRGMTLRRALGVTVLLVLLLAFLQPMVAHSRALHAVAYGDLEGGTLEERLGYAAEYIRGDRYRAGDEMSGFARISHLNSATLVVGLRDSGIGGDTIESALISLVPRIFWPEKPITSAVGTDLYYLATGQFGSALAPTLFGDIYWNLGWLGVLLLIPVGIFLGFTTTISYRIVRARDWFMMPFVLLVFQIGLAADGAFVLTVFAPSFMAIIGFFILRSLKKLLKLDEPSRPRWAAAQPVMAPRARPGG